MASELTPIRRYLLGLATCGQLGCLGSSRLPAAAPLQHPAHHKQGKPPNQDVPFAKDLH
jgi:hypothetical protein